MEIHDIVDLELETTEAYRKANGLNRRDWHYKDCSVIMSDGFITVILNPPSSQDQQIFRSFPFDALSALAGYSAHGNKFVIK